MHTLPARPKAAVTVCVCLSFSLASSSDSAAASATAAAAAAATAETAELWTKPLPPAADGNLTASAAVAVLNREALRVVSQESRACTAFRALRNYLQGSSTPRAATCSISGTRWVARSW